VCGHEDEGGWRGGGHGRCHRDNLLSFTDGGRLKQALGHVACVPLIKTHGLTRDTQTHTGTVKTTTLVLVGLLSKRPDRQDFLPRFIKLKPDSRPPTTLTHKPLPQTAQATPLPTLSSLKL